MNLATSRAARFLLDLWDGGRRAEALPADLRPTSRAAAYEIGAAIGALKGDHVAGWKIAATSVAGQKHINVDGPLAGRIFAGKLVAPGSAVAIGTNIMKVAEAEFAFSFGRDLPPPRSGVLARRGSGRGGSFASVLRGSRLTL